MKILFIGADSFDYLQDLTYSGLTKLIGSHNVIEHRVISRYHFPIKKYPKNLGYNHIDLNFIPNSLIRNFDVVMVAATKPSCFEQYNQLLPKLKSSTKTIFIDGGDWASIGGDLERLKAPNLYDNVTSQRPFDYIFKREYMINEQYSSNVLPLPFSINLNKYSNLSDFDFKYDVSFWAVESHPIRTQVLNLLENRFDCNENGTTKKQVFKKYKRKGRFYFEELKRCKISLNFRGAGWDTLRFWEIMALKRFMISQPLDIVIPDNYENGKEIIYCNSDLSDLTEICEYYLKNDSIREQIAANAHAKTLKSHTDVARAKFILNEISKR